MRLLERVSGVNNSASSSTHFKSSVSLRFSNLCVNTRAKYLSDDVHAKTLRRKEDNRKRSATCIEQYRNRGMTGLSCWHDDCSKTRHSSKTLQEDSSKPGSESNNVYKVHQGAQSSGLPGRVVHHRHDLYHRIGNRHSAKQCSRDGASSRE